MPFSQYGPCGDGAIRHLGVPSSFTTGSPGLVSDAVNAEYQKICCAMLPWPGTGPASENVMPGASGGAYFLSHSMYLASEYTAAGLLASPPRLTAAPTGWQSSTRMPPSSAGRPLGRPLLPVPPIDSHASVNRQPSDGSFLP